MHFCFARNTVDSLSTIRKLKEKGVECYFEKENIWTFDGKGEVLLTIMSSFAQEESRSISENILWGVKRRHEDGRISLAYSKFLGYDKGETGSLVINPVQAETVRFIFKSFLEGRSPYSIAQDLIKRGDRTGSGGTNWKAESIVRILRNEKYAGNAILQKSYKPDLLAKRRTNNGEVQKYFVTDSHPAIITPEQYDMVQQELADRHSSLRQHASKSIFSDRIFCADCGCAFGSKVWHSTDKYKRTIWQCNSKFKNETKCTTPHLTEDEIKNIYLKALNQLITDKTSVIEDLQQICSMLLHTQELEGQLKKAQEELSIATRIVQEYFNGRPVTENDVTNGVFDTYQKQYTQAKQKAEDLQNRITERKRKAANLKRFIKSIDEMDSIFETFSPQLWTGLCDHMTVHPDKTVTVTFKSGTEISLRN